MFTLKQSIALILCLVQLPYLTNAFFKASRLRKRMNLGSMSGRTSMHSEILFKNTLPPITMGPKHGSLVLECSANAIPAVTIHWLKDGVRILQGYSNSVEDDSATYEGSAQSEGLVPISVSTTKSRLYLDCLTSRHEAQYTCVAETPFAKNIQNTTVKVVKRDYDIFNEVRDCTGKRSRRVEPARIFMWSASRLQYEGLSVQLFCRTEGFPKPAVAWYDRDNNKIVDDDVYQYLENGDLLINSITWLEHMGTFTCVADNGLDTDSIVTFLYPVARE